MPSQKEIFRGRVIRLNLETVRLPNGKEAELEIIHHPGGAAVLAVNEANHVCLLRQFRHAAGGYVWELPAGKIDNREPPLQTAQRELEEEAGCRAEQWDSLGDCLSSPGVFTEVVHLFLARDLSAVHTHQDSDEVIEIHWRPFRHALEMAGSGELRDGKSMAALFRAVHRYPELSADKSRSNDSR